MCFNVWSFLQVLHCCNEDIKLSAAFSRRHIKHKIHAPESTKTRHFYFKNSKIFWGGGTAPSPDLSPSRTHSPRRLRRLDLHAFGAHSRTPHSEVWLRAWYSYFGIGSGAKKTLASSYQLNYDIMQLVQVQCQYRASPCLAVLTRDKHHRFKCLLIVYVTLIFFYNSYKVRPSLSCSALSVSQPHNKL